MVLTQKVGCLVIIDEASPKSEPQIQRGKWEFGLWALWALSEINHKAAGKGKVKGYFKLTTCGEI